MTDYSWPQDLAPYQIQFYLQPHTGRSISPFTRQQKVYGLSAPRWIARLVFRGPYWGAEGAAAYGPRLDAFLAKLKGGQNRVAIWDFRREAPLGDQRDVAGMSTGFDGLVYGFDDGTIFTDLTGFEDVHSTLQGNAPAASGATQITFTNYYPGAVAFRAGDYIGGDGRPHIVTDDARVNGSGEVTVHFEPPLAGSIAENMALTIRPKGWFRLVSDDAGANMSEVGRPATYDLELWEDV